MSRLSGYQAGAAVLGVLAAISVVVAAVTIGVAEAGGTAQPAGASVLDASSADPATAVAYQVSGAAQRAHTRMRGLVASGCAWRTRVGLLHAGQCEPGRTTLRSRGTR